jgi:hypothetical protein
MPVYHFILKPTGRSQVIDRDGEELSDDAAAFRHAVDVAREIMRHHELNCRPYRLEVRDENLQTCFEILFASVDEELAHLRVNSRNSVIKASQSIASLDDSFGMVKQTMDDVIKALAAADETLSRVTR